MDLILCMAGVEVSLPTWRMWEEGLRFSLHNLTATYELVHYQKHVTSYYYYYYYYFLTNNPNTHWMHLCLSSILYSPIPSIFVLFIYITD